MLTSHGFLVAYIPGFALIDSNSQGLADPLLWAVILILLMGIAGLVGAGIAGVIGVRYLFKKAFNRNLPRWVTVILFLIIVTGVPFAYNLWQKGMAEKYDQDSLAKINFTIFEPNTTIAGYERQRITARPDSDPIHSHLEFFYLDPSKRESSSRRTLTVYETKNDWTKLCNYIPPEVYNNSRKTPECSFQTTPGGLKWYHSDDVHGDQKSDYTIKNGTRVTITHSGLTDEQLNDFFDELTQKQATELDTNKNPRRFSFFGIEF